MRLNSLTALLFLSFSACATHYENTAIKSWDLMRSGQIDDALKSYEKNVTDAKEKLLRLMDEGILFRVAGRFDESNRKFFEAAKMIEMNGYLSLGEQATTLLTNEKQTTYQGEDFEKVLVHLYLGLNFLSLNQFDEALVETRKVNEILFKMISEAKRPYELNAFARYLGGVLFENDKNENDALVAYRNTLKIDPKIASYFPVIKQDLIRMAKLNGMDQELDEFKKEYGRDEFEKALASLKEKKGSILLVFETGKSPKKVSSRETHRTRSRRTGEPTLGEVVLPVAYYKKRPYRITSALIEVAGQSAKSAALNSIEDTAIIQLKDRMGRAIAKALLTASVKAGIATGVGIAANSKELGLLTGIALVLASEADTRSWLLLPAELQMAKLFVAPGKYSLKISYQDTYGNTVESETTQIDVKPKQTTILQRRKFD